MQHSASVQASDCALHTIRSGVEEISFSLALQSNASPIAPSALVSAHVRGGGGATVQHTLAVQADAQTTLAGVGSTVIELVCCEQSYTSSSTPSAFVSAHVRGGGGASHAVRSALTECDPAQVSQLTPDAEYCPAGQFSQAVRAAFGP